ncbi:immunoglobulin superfamily member 1-like [Hoplias malabaricus]|uniref:immunoglobulin superfamily member 1-like n=1 Tax=Hoplias malabaricus TaxID=27720 RepID=UPI00346322B1
MELSALSVILLLIGVIYSGQTVEDSTNVGPPKPVTDAGSGEATAVSEKADGESHGGDEASQVRGAVSQEGALPTPSLTVEPKGELFTGDSVTLKCEITTDGDWTYVWERVPPEESATGIQADTEDRNTQSVIVAAVDGAQYKCRVQKSDRTQSSPYSTPVTLTVKALPTPTLTVEPDGEVFTGESVALKCKIKDYSGWTYQWEKQNSDEWKPVSQSEYDTVNTGTINIREDSAAVDNYRCRGNRQGRPDSSNYSVVLKLTVNTLPTPTLTVEPDGEVFTGESVALKCKIKDYSGWTYQWEKQNSDEWKPVSQSEYYTVNTGTINIRKEYVRNGDQYQCKGQKTGRSLSSHYSEHATLSVKALPSPTLTVKPEGDVFRGQSVTLTCEIKVLNGWMYEWEKKVKGSKGTSVSQSEFYNIYRDTHTIRQDDVKDGDQYRCRGSNTGRGLSSPYSEPVTVKAPPTPSLTIEPDGDVFRGDTVTLKCEIKSDLRWTYQWEKMDGRSWWSYVYQSESYTVNTDTLTIRSVTDGGQYRCRGWNSDRQIWSQNSNTFTLTVKALPSPTLTVKPEGDVFRGQSVTLTCEIKVLNGWMYEWEKKVKGSKGTSVSQSEFYNIYRDTHTIRQDDVKDGDQYRCRGSNTGRGLSSPYSEPVTVKAPPTPSLTIEPDGDVFRGDTVTLKCEIKSDLRWTYQWEKMDGRSWWSYVYQSESYTVNTDTLTIRSVTDGGQYRCRGWNSDRQIWSQNSNTFTLTVKALPSPTLTVKPEGDVFRGQSVTLTCEIKVLNGWMYEWEKKVKGSKGTSVSQSEFYNIYRDTHTIRQDDVKDGDQYRCRGSNTGRGLSSPYSEPVTVKAPPTPSLTVKPDGDVFRGDTVTLKCEIKSDLRWTYQWEKWKKWNTRGSWSEVPQSWPYTVNTDTLTIRSVTDGGQYRCRGWNYGRRIWSQGSNTFTLTVKAPPTPSLTVEPEGDVFRGDTVTLKCEIKSDLRWTYVWKKWNTRGSWSEVPESWPYTVNTDTLTIRSVTDGGQYRCRGWNSDRQIWSQNSNTFTLTVKALPSPTLTVKPEGDVFRGQSVTLTCEIKVLNGWMYEWEKKVKGSKGTSVSQSEFYNIYRDTHTIRQDDVKDGDQYRCRGSNTGRGLSSPYSEPVTVKALPSATLTVQPQGAVFTGESVTLMCKIAGFNGWTYHFEKQNKQSEWTTVSQSVKHPVNSITFTIREDTPGFVHFRCRGQRQERPKSSQNSDTLTLTVKEKPKPELTSSRKGPALRGQPVVLFCELGQSAGWKFYWSKHTLNSENETCTETHFYTISSVSDSDGGQYWCRAGRGNPLYFTHYSDALWVNVTATSQGVSLVVSPSRTQHFSTDPLSLSCEGQRDSTGWRVRRYTHSEKVSNCSSVTGSTCNISSLSTSHTGVYWCESESGAGSEPVNITVHNGSVIMESPVHPVTEGDSLTLRCLYRDPKPSNLTADFYKNGSLLQTQTTAEMTIHTVSQSDEGLYHCNNSQKGESPKSWVSVRASGSKMLIIGGAVGLSLFLLIIILSIFLCHKKKGTPKSTDLASEPSQNTASTPLQNGGDQVYANADTVGNTNTDDSADASSDVTYAQVTFNKKAARGNVRSENEKPYSQIEMKNLKSHSKDDAIPAPNDTVYAQILAKNNKLKGSEAKPSQNAVYADIDLKGKKTAKKNKTKEKSSVGADTVYSELKQNTDDAIPAPNDAVYSQILAKNKKLKNKGP